MLSSKYGGQLLPAYVEERGRRINIKSKRRKNLFKKAMELKSMCGLEVLIILKDPDYNKVQVYNSSSEGSFPDNKVLQMLKHDGKGKGPKIRYFTDEDYN